MNILAGSNILEPAALIGVFVVDKMFSIVFVLNALQCYYNSNVVDVLGRKYVLGPSQISF